MIYWQWCIRMRMNDEPDKLLKCVMCEVELDEEDSRKGETLCPNCREDVYGA